MPHDLLARLAELERCYDGPVPEGLRLAAHLGSAEAAELLFAAGEEAFYKSMVARQLDIIRRRRADRTLYASLLDDLRYYRDAWRQWHRRARAMRAAAAGRQP